VQSSYTSPQRLTASLNTLKHHFRPIIVLNLCSTPADVPSTMMYFLKSKRKQLGSFLRSFRMYIIIQTSQMRLRTMICTQAVLRQVEKIIGLYSKRSEGYRNYLSKEDLYQDFWVWLLEQPLLANMNEHSLLTFIREHSMAPLNLIKPTSRRAKKNRQFLVSQQPCARRGRNGRQIEKASLKFEPLDHLISVEERQLMRNAIESLGDESKDALLVTLRAYPKHLTSMELAQSRNCTPQSVNRRARLARDLIIKQIRKAS
jgi:hypothetical protein